MNKVRSTIQGMILTAFFIMLSHSAHAFFNASAQWGTGFSPGMQGCMAETDAYSGLTDDLKEAIASIEIAKVEMRNIKGEIKKIEDDVEDAEDRKDGNNVAAVFALDEEIKEIIKMRAKALQMEKFDISSDGLIESVDVEDKELDIGADGSAWGSCPKNQNEIKHASEARKVMNSSNFENEIDSEKFDVKYKGDPSSTPFIKACVAGGTLTKGREMTYQQYNQLQQCVGKKIGGLPDVPTDVNPDKYYNSCKEDSGINAKYICNSVSSKAQFEKHKKWTGVSDCIEDVEQYFEDLTDLNYFEDVHDKFTKRNGVIDEAEDIFKEAAKDAEGDVCIGCAGSGYARSQEGPSTTDVVIGALAGLTGQYLGLRAYKSAQNNAIDAAAQLGHTMQPTPNFNLYSGLGLSAISTISGLASGAYMCAGAGPYGGVQGMNNPYAMQMAMMGQGGAFGYPFGQQMGSAQMGMYMPGMYGQMGPMGLHMPTHMMGNMHPALSSMMNPYASMMGPSSMYNPMASLGPMGMMGMPGAQLGMQGGFNPYGMMSPYAMMSPFGGLSATAGMGSFAMNPYQMMNPSMMGGMSGLGGMMSCIQAPCPGQLYNPMGMGMGMSGGLGLGIGAGMQGLNGLGTGGAQQQQQWLQMQMQMLQQQQQQQMAYYQQVQSETQRKMAAAQQLTQLQQQMQQLNMQAAQISSQVGGVNSGYSGGYSIPGLSIGGGIGIGGGYYGGSLGGSLMMGYPYGSGLGQFSPNTPTYPSVNAR